MAFSVIALPVVTAMGEIMILLALALAAQGQWTGPRTIEYRGPGYYCGGGYAIHLAKGDRALVLPQGQAPQVTRIVVAGREVNIHTGARPRPGRVVLKHAGSVVTQQSDGGSVEYTISDDTPFGLSVTSGAFRGYKNDGWFFSKADFDADVDQRVSCLAAFSY